MKSPLVPVICVLAAAFLGILGIIAYTDHRVVRVIHDEDGYTETFYNTPCTDPIVIAIARARIVPESAVDKMFAGKVTGPSGSRNFCYRDNPNGESTFIVDDHGSMGNLQIPK